MDCLNSQHVQGSTELLQSFLMLKLIAKLKSLHQSLNSRKTILKRSARSHLLEAGYIYTILSIVFALFTQAFMKDSTLKQRI